VTVVLDVDVAVVAVVVGTQESQTTGQISRRCAPNIPSQVQLGLNW